MKTLAIRVLKANITKKFAKYAVLALLVWFSYHSFNTNYVVINSNGVHGVISRATWSQIQTNAVNSAAFNSIPDKYLTNQ